MMRERTTANQFETSAFQSSWFTRTARGAHDKSAGPVRRTVVQANERRQLVAPGSDPGPLTGWWSTAHIRMGALAAADLVALLGINLLLIIARLVNGEAGELSFSLSGRPDLIWHASGIGVIALMLFARLAERGHYTLRLTYLNQTLDLCSACMLALFCDVLLTTLIYHDPLAIGLLLRWVLMIPAALLMRNVARLLLDRVGLWQLNTLLIGEPALADRAERALTADASMGYRVVGRVSADSVGAYREAAQWHGLMARSGAEFIAVAGGSGATEAEDALLSSLNLARVPLTFVPATNSLSVVHCRPQHIHRHDTLLLTCPSRLNEPMSRWLKVVMDYAVAGILCIVTTPLLLVIAAAVKMDGGPVLFQHTRIGRGGRPFKCMKFRTMAVDSDAALARLLQSDPAAADEWERTRKLTNDPRITRVGDFLRRTSMDELPQLLNVLRGEMSLVGPRPIVAAEIPMYGRAADFYKHMKPGVTGLWQTSGRSSLAYEDRVKLDVWYAMNWRLGHDVAILLDTVFVVFSRRGAV